MKISILTISQGNKKWYEVHLYNSCTGKLESFTKMTTGTMLLCYVTKLIKNYIKEFKIKK